MIEMIASKERNLKNLKQIGTPQEEDKVYVENLAYSKLKEDSYKEKRVFVLMGHTERMNGRYATFVEAVIPVTEIEFSGGIPRWNNIIWGGVFREIKRIYEDMIIVGWAYDAKGMALRMTHELERVHREHFGGIHQLIFLMDSLEQEETFYTYKENRLVSKDGFFIYYHAKMSRSLSEDTKEEGINLALDIPDAHRGFSRIRELQQAETETSYTRGGQYRELLRSKDVKEESAGTNIGIAVAVALLMFIIGIGAYENRDSIFGKNDVPTIVESKTEDKETSESASQTTEAANASETEISEAAEAGYTIPIEIISGEEQKSSD